MSHLERQLSHARPKLRIVSPLAYWIILVLGIFNLFLGSSLFFAVDQSKFTASLLIVNDVLTFHFWGIVFVSIGLVKLYSIFTNNWFLARNSLFIGVVVKAIWMVALTIRTFVSPGTVFLDLSWIAIALIQMGTYVFFMPPAMGSYRQMRADRKND